jgi:hypothetical protein
MKLKWLAGMAALDAVAAQGQLDRARVTVWLENVEIADPVVLAGAKGEASDIFKQVGVEVGWRLGAPGKHLGPGENIEMVFDADAPPCFDETAMAYATVGATVSTAIHVFYTRVVRSHARGLAPALLGHVMAHEITHVLESVARHSDEGLMKARWDTQDYDQMREGPLPFAPIDAELVREHFGL